MILPLFSYPSTIMCIDDDKLFLQTLTQLLSTNNFIMSFGSPQVGIDFFQSYTPPMRNIHFTRGCIDTEKYDMLNHMPVDFCAKTLQNLRNNPERYSEITVLLTDYNMPTMNGIELCRQLRDFPMKKILLTGEAEHQLAVAAFNEGIIDAFIRKDSSDIAEDIANHTSRLTQNYFIQNTKRLRDHLETDYKLPLSDPRFCEYFSEWCLQHNIREYYLVDKNGNILLMNEQGEKSYFVIHTNRTLNHFTALHDDDEAVMHFIQAVNLREKIPFFGEGIESWELNTEQWSTCFYAPQILIGAEKYYWSVAA